MENATPRPWTMREQNELLRLSGEMNYTEMSRHFGRSRRALMAKLRLLLQDSPAKAATCFGKGDNGWSNFDIQELLRLAPELPNPEIAAEMGRSRSAVAAKLHKLGFKRPKSYFAYSSGPCRDLNRPA